MERKEWNQWQARRGDEPAAFLQVGLYITDVYPSDEWHARTVEFVEEVEAQAEEVYEDRGVPGLEAERNRIDEQVEKQHEEFQRVRLHQSGFELIAARIRVNYNDFEGQVVEDLEVVPRGAFVPDPDGPEGLEGLRAPEGPLVLRPDGETYRLEPTVRLLKGYEMPTDVLRHYSFGVLQVTYEDTWEDLAAMVDEQVEFQKENTQKAHRKLKFLRARREVYDALLERRAMGKDMPWEQAENATIPEDGRDFVGSPDGWEVNCARMYAYLEGHQMPDRLRPDLDEAIERNTSLDSFSFSHAWRQLRKGCVQ